MAKKRVAPRVRRSQVESIGAGVARRLRHGLDQCPRVDADLRRMIEAHFKSTVDLFALLDRTVTDLTQQVNAEIARREAAR
jgi:hypothetical protein